MVAYDAVSALELLSHRYRIRGVRGDSLRGLSMSDPNISMKDFWETTSRSVTYSGLEPRGSGYTLKGDTALAYGIPGFSLVMVTIRASSHVPSI